MALQKGTDTDEHGLSQESTMVAPVRIDAANLESQNVRIGKPSQSAACPGSLPSDDIEYRYLTFESDIPLSPVFPLNSSVQGPPCPNLTDYDNPFDWSLTRKNLMT